MKKQEEFRFNFIRDKYKKLLWTIIVLLITACVSTPKAIKTKPIIYINTYVDPINDLYVKYYKQIRKFELIFINDTICVFRNTFFCNDIAREYKIIDQECKYIIINESLIVNDVNEKHPDMLFIDIPIQDSKKCSFFTEQGRQILIDGGGSLYSQYGKVPNITTDTLYFKSHNPNVITLYKKCKYTSDSIYCEFEMQQPLKRKQVSIK
jgi:lipoprotein